MRKIACTAPLKKNYANAARLSRERTRVRAFNLLVDLPNEVELAAMGRICRRNAKGCECLNASLRAPGNGTVV
jgi:hypothetical protein